MNKPQTVGEYLDGFSGAARVLLEELHTLARGAVPAADEVIKWGHPAWVHPSGTILFVVSGHAKHANFTFTPSTREAFDSELGDVETGKGTVKLPYGSPPPADLLRRMIAYRVREHEDDGVLWK
ncbi:iron chaperone [Krasilnikovia sp. MM14-A1259]|uniref:iron chaperone n=1 Tax=Krasilnikovia sp. MM14-A1259 TaxID=3373539 RepID=UPI0038079B7F